MGPPVSIAARLLGAPTALPVLFVLYALPRALMLLLPVEPSSDASWYFHRAAAVAGGLGYSEDGVLTAFWPPGFAFALAALFKLFGPWVPAGQMLNFVCALGTAWLTYDLGRRLFHSELAGRAALLLLAIYPNNIAYVPLLLTEVFYTVLLLAGCWLLIVWRSAAGVVAGGLVFGVATLVKAQSLVVVPLIFAVAVARDFDRRRALLAMGKTIAVIAVAIAVVAPWGYRNYRVFGEFVPVSTNGGLTLLTGNNSSARGDYSYDDPLVTSIPRTVATQLAVDKEARRRAVQWISDHPRQFLLLLPFKVFRLWAPDGEAEHSFQLGYKGYERHVVAFRTVRYLNQAYYVCLLVGFAWAAVILLRGTVRVSEYRFDWWILPYAIALYPTAIALVFSGQSRFHYPVMPFVAMCSGWLLVTACGFRALGGPRKAQRIAYAKVAS